MINCRRGRSLPTIGAAGSGAQDDSGDLPKEDGVADPCTFWWRRMTLDELACLLSIP